MRFVRPFEALTLDDIAEVGGKNASFGEMIGALAPLGVRVPGGFALSAHAYRALLDAPGVRDAVRSALHRLDVRDMDSLRETGARCRRALRDAPWPADLLRELEEAYEALSAGLRRPTRFDSSAYWATIRSVFFDRAVRLRATGGRSARWPRCSASGRQRSPGLRGSHQLTPRGPGRRRFPARADPSGAATRQRFWFRGSQGLRSLGHRDPVVQGLGPH